MNSQTKGEDLVVVSFYPMEGNGIALPKGRPPNLKAVTEKMY